MTQTFLSQLNWRYATKVFDINKVVEDEKLAKIIEAIRMTPTSMGLQTFHTYVVTDSKTKGLIEKQAYGQKQVSTSSHIIILCYRTDIDQSINDYVDLVTREKLMSLDKIGKVKESRKKYFDQKTSQEIKEWSARQQYITLGFAMAACAELGVDSCPMEGFNSKEVDEILNLPESIKSVLLLPIGYRKEEPKKKKIRFLKKDLFTFVE
jgi:nitroreductase / dihydropteridine reductase